MITLAETSPSAGKHTASSAPDPAVSAEPGPTRSARPVLAHGTGQIALRLSTAWASRKSFGVTPPAECVVVTSVSWL